MLLRVGITLVLMSLLTLPAAASDVRQELTKQSTLEQVIGAV